MVDTDDKETNEMKIQLKNNSEVCHVFIHQGQYEGRTDNLFFQGDTLYGFHYTAGKIYNEKNKKFLIINNDRYSNSTAKHLSELRSACSGVMPYFYGSPYSIKETYLNLKNILKNTIERNLKTSKVSSKDHIKFALEYIQDCLKDVNDFAKLTGNKQIKVKSSEIAAVKKHLESRLKRYNELNTPEQREKREKQALRRKELKDKKFKEQIAQDLILWRQGEYRPIVRNLHPQVLRIKDDTLETSGGARVGLNKAKTMYRALIQGKNIVGQKIDHYTVDYVEKTDSDIKIKIGCHTIMLSEVQSVLGKIPELKVV